MSTPESPVIGPTETPELRLEAALWAAQRLEEAFEEARTPQQVRFWEKRARVMDRRFMTFPGESPGGGSPERR